MFVYQKLLCSTVEVSIVQLSPAYQKLFYVDLILFGGDIYSNDSFETDQVSQILKNIHSRYGKFAVLGEKDQGDSTNNTNLLTEAGFEVLHNELRYIYYKGSIVDLLGLENSGDCSGLISEDNKDHYKIALVVAIKHHSKHNKQNLYLIPQDQIEMHMLRSRDITCMRSS